MQDGEGSPIPHSIPTTSVLGLQPSSRIQKNHKLPPMWYNCSLLSMLCCLSLLYTHKNTCSLRSVCHSISRPDTPLEATPHWSPPFLTVDTVKPVNRYNHLQAPHQDKRLMPREATGHPGAMESALGVVSRLDSLHVLPWPYIPAGSLRSLDTASYAEVGRANLAEGSWALCTGFGLTWPSLTSLGPFLLCQQLLLARYTMVDPTECSCPAVEV